MFLKDLSVFFASIRRAFEVNFRSRASYDGLPRGGEQV